MKIRSLLIASLLIIAIAIFTGFYTEKSDTEQITYVLTVESEETAKPASFDLAITKDLKESESPELTILEDQRTPFKIELKNANYQIVVHKTSDAGNITSQIEKRRSDIARALANATGNVVVLNTNEDSGVSAFGMK